jgi:hypothetical protein
MTDCTRYENRWIERTIRYSINRLHEIYPLKDAFDNTFSIRSQCHTVYEIFKNCYQVSGNSSEQRGRFTALRETRSTFEWIKLKWTPIFVCRCLQAIVELWIAGPKLRGISRDLMNPRCFPVVCRTTADRLRSTNSCRIHPIKGHICVSSIQTVTILRSAALLIT